MTAMIHKTKEYVAKYSKLILIFVLIVSAALLLLWGRNSSGKSFKIEDKCGRFVNVVSHTIGDSMACKTRCTSQCESTDMKYKNSIFEETNACNSCTCECK